MCVNDSFVLAHMTKDVIEVVHYPIRQLESFIATNCQAVTPRKLSSSCHVQLQLHTNVTKGGGHRLLVRILTRRPTRQPLPVQYSLPLPKFPGYWLCNDLLNDTPALRRAELTVAVKLTKGWSHKADQSKCRAYCGVRIQNLMPTPAATIDT